MTRLPTDSTPADGQLANGRFEVRGTLGSGGAGIVYRVHDRELGREVALKLLRKASGRDLYRFKREFRTLADIVHPNLVALHELHATADNDWYITMELVEGVSFIDWMRPGRLAGPVRTRNDIHDAALDETRLREGLPQLADALHALHVAGKLHRDLKPSNVLVTPAGRVVLLDFGLVLALAESGREGLAVGTPVYMSPEQASDQALGPASDWYGVGAMLYEALTGRRPFEGDSEQVMTRKQRELPAQPAPVAASAKDLSTLAMALLQPRPAARPTGDEVLAALGTTASAVALSNTRAATPVMIGRERELEALERALADARRSGTAVLVRGKSGIGKSTLVRTFLERQGDTVFVVAGRCFEREAVPFKMLDGVVDALTGAILTLPPIEVAGIVPPEIGSLVRMFPVLRRVEQLSELVGGHQVPVDPQELRRRGFRGLATLFGRLALLRPLILFVDDAHWGDADSAAFLAQLVHEPQKHMLVMVAHRPEDYLGVIATLRRPPGGNARPGDLREIEIGALDDAAATKLVAALGGDSSGRTEIALAAAAGNPLVLSEMARAPSLAAGMRIEDLVRERATRLPLDAQALLAITSVAARPLSVEIAAHAAGVVGGLEAASQLSVERLATLHQVDGEMILHPAHDYVRTSVLSLLDTEAKASFHEAIARAFEAVQGAEKLDSLAVVEHWLAAGHPANAAHHAVDAAQRAEELLAFRRAAELYEIALTFGPWDTAGQRDLLRRKAHALACAGALDEAAEIYGHAAQLLPDAEAIDLERLRVEALLRRGRLAEALPAAERLLGQIGIRIPLGARASRTRLATQWLAAKLRGLEYTEREPSDIPPAKLLSIDVLYSVASGLAFADPSLGRVVQGELMRAALDAGEPIRVCLALAQEVCYAAAGGSRNRTAVEAVGARLRAIATKVGRPEVIGFADAAVGIAAHMSGRWRDARASLEAGLAALRDHGAGVRWEIDIADTFWLATLFYLGEWREMARLTEKLLRDAIERADVVAQSNLRIGRCNFAWLVSDRPEIAREQLAIAERGLRDDSFRLQDSSLMIAAANIDLYTGDPKAAFHRIDGVWSQLEAIGCLRLQQPRIELALLRARALLAVGGHDQRREARVHAELMIKEGAPWATGLGHLVRASVHAFAGGVEAARAELLTAEEHLISTGMLGYLQIARMRRGALEGGTIGTARSTTAREVLSGLGAVDTGAVIRHLLPWPE